MSSEIITVIAACITAIGVVVGVYRIVAYHEYRRREHLIELMQFWVQTVSKDSLIRPVVAFVDKLDKEGCEHVYRGDEFKVSTSHFDTAQNIAAQIGIVLDRTEPFFVVPRAMSQAISGKVSVALNALETVATAWRTGVADRDLVIDEFITLFKPQGDGRFLFSFREVIGIYPSIRLVEREIEKRSEATPRREIARFFGRR